jgi:hypothetical protein
MGSHKGSTRKVDNESYSFDLQNEFVARAKGTLPETITEADLGTLNSGLRFLFADLREAQRRFEAEADGRLSAFTALGAMWRFLVLFQAPYAEKLQVPILLLEDALSKLEENLVMPIVRPRKHPGHPSSSNAHAALRGNVAATVELLSENGLDRPQGCRQVAELLKDLGVRKTRGSGEITDRTVNGWCEEAAEDVGRQGVVAMACDSVLIDIRPKMSVLPQDQARRWALDGLAAFVQTFFPETRTGRRKSS